MNSSVGSVCPFYPDITVDSLVHHPVSYRHSGDVVMIQSPAKHFYVVLLSCSLVCTC